MKGREGREGKGRAWKGKDARGREGVAGEIRRNGARSERPVRNCVTHYDSSYGTVKDQRYVQDRAPLRLLSELSDTGTLSMRDDYRYLVQRQDAAAQSRARPRPGSVSSPFFHSGWNAYDGADRPIPPTRGSMMSGVSGVYGGRAGDGVGSRMTHGLPVPENGTDTRIHDTYPKGRVLHYHFERPSQHTVQPHSFQLPYRKQAATEATPRHQRHDMHFEPDRMSVGGYQGNARVRQRITLPPPPTTARTEKFSHRGDRISAPSGSHVDPYGVSELQTSQASYGTNSRPIFTAMGKRSVRR